MKTDSTSPRRTFTEQRAHCAGLGALGTDLPAELIVKNRPHSFCLSLFLFGTGVVSWQKMPEDVRICTAPTKGQRLWPREGCCSQSLLQQPHDRLCSRDWQLVGSALPLPHSTPQHRHFQRRTRSPDHVHTECCQDSSQERTNTPEDFQTPPSRS